MQTKNAKSINKAERAYLDLVKSLPCSVCDAHGPCEAHHIDQGNHFATVALCYDCHRGPFNGLHGQRRIWKIKKLSITDALATTIRRVVERIIKGVT